MASLAACCACQGASCLGNLACNCFGQATSRSSKLTRLAYTAIFMIVSLGSWAWYSWGAEWYQEKFPHSVIHFHCQEDVCFGAMSVYRITSILTIFYLVHAVIAAACRKAKVNAKWWGVKLVALVLGIVLTFFIPNPVFQVWAWIALIGGAFFILVQLVLLVEFAHSWSESWIANWNEDPDKKGWWYGLLIATICLYMVTLALTVAEFIVFSAGSGCDTNAVFVAVNILFVLSETAISVHPTIQEKNPNSGLLQSATVGAYTTYLIWSALMSQPDKTCNTISGGKQSFSAVAGAVIVFISVCYSAFRVSTKSESMWANRDDLEEATTRSILDTPADNEEQEDEQDDQAFNYTFFHVCFALASCYVTMLITNWMLVEHNEDTSSYVIDQSIGSMWVKIVSSWVAHVLYIWSLVAPVLLPNREWYT